MKAWTQPSCVGVHAKQLLATISGQSISLGQLQLGCWDVYLCQATMEPGLVLHSDVSCLFVLYESY